MVGCIIVAEKRTVRKKREKGNRGGKEMVKQKYLDKAEVLIEALPYIQRFNRKIVVIKYGGSAMLGSGAESKCN